jgi:hypothetical protein
MSRLRLPMIFGLLMIAAFAVLSVHLAALPADPPTWGFIDLRVICKPTGEKPFRAEVVSQIFAYCAADISDAQIMQDNAGHNNEAVRSACRNAPYEITYSLVYASSDRGFIAKKHDEELNAGGYQVHDQFYCSCTYYMSSKCHSKEY